MHRLGNPQLQRPHQLIQEMKPPATFKLKMSNSAREKALNRISEDWDAGEALRSNNFLKSRATMVGSMTASKPKQRAPSPIRAAWHPANRDDFDESVALGDGTFAKGKAGPSAHADADGEKQEYGPVALPSDDE